MVETRKEQEQNARFLRALDELDPHGSGASANKIRGLAKFGADVMSQTTIRLLVAHVVEEVDGFRADAGSGSAKPAKGIRRAVPVVPISDLYSEPSYPSSGLRRPFVGSPQPSSGDPSSASPKGGDAADEGFTPEADDPSSDGRRVEEDFE